MPSLQQASLRFHWLFSLNAATRLGGLAPPGNATNLYSQTGCGKRRTQWPHGCFWSHCPSDEYWYWHETSRKDRIPYLLFPPSAFSAGELYARSPLAGRACRILFRHHWFTVINTTNDATLKVQLYSWPLPMDILVLYAPTKRFVDWVGFWGWGKGDLTRGNPKETKSDGMEMEPRLPVLPCRRHQPPARQAHWGHWFCYLPHGNVHPM